MHIELSPSQEAELKEQLQQEKKKPRHWLCTILCWAVAIAIFGLIAWAMDDSLNMDGHSKTDNFDSCWNKADVKGINTKTGEDAIMSKHFNCDDFRPEKLLKSN